MQGMDVVRILAFFYSRLKKENTTLVLLSDGLFSWMSWMKTQACGLSVRGTMLVISLTFQFSMLTPSTVLPI